MERVVGLALSGGGACGSYEIGAIKALLEAGYRFDWVSGSSVGAINGALLAQGDFLLLEKLWKKLSLPDIAKNVELPQEEALSSSAVYAQFLKASIERGGVDISGLATILSELLDEERFFGSPVNFGLVAAEYPTLKPVRVSKGEMAPGSVIDWILGSAACFPAFPVHVFSDKRLIDGGYHDNLPINLCEELGAPEVIAIELDAPGLRIPPKNKKLPVQVLRPRHPLGPMLLFDPQGAERNIQLGYLDGLRFTGEGEGDYITFKKGQQTLLFHRLEGGVLNLIQTMCGKERKVLSKLLEHKKQLTETRFVAVLQSLAQWYDLEVTDLYTAHSYSYELLLQVNAGGALYNEETAAAMLTPGSERRRSEALLALTPRQVCQHILAKLREWRQGRGSMGELLAFFTLCPNQSAGAILLLAMKDYYASESGNDTLGDCNTNLSLKPIQKNRHKTP